jgi:peptidyl-prolyl cis-trans isomerase SurA
MKQQFAPLVGVLAAAAALTVPARADIIEQILVRVNGEIFTRTQLETRQIQAIRQLDRQLDASVGDAELAKMLDEVTPELIVTAVDEMLMIQHGRTLGYKMSDEQFNSVLDNIKKENKLESDELFQAALKQENMTIADLRTNLERQMIVSYVQQQEVLGRVAVNDTEARRYYDSHLSEFTKPQEVMLREIFVAVPGDGATVNVAADESARERATTLRERVLSGEPFEKLAADASDSPSKANAGLIGPLSLSDLSEDLGKLLQSMKPGDVSDLLRTPRGYQILKLESATTAETQTFEQVREEVGNRVFAAKRQEELLKFLDRLRSEAIIEWKVPELKAQYDRGLAQLRTLATERVQ